MKSRLALALLLAAVVLSCAAAWFTLSPGGEVGESREPALREETRPVPLPGGKVPVAGLVVDEAGDPVESASVYLLTPGDPTVPVEAPRLSRTDTEGRFSLLRGEDEKADLVACRPGYRPTLVASVMEGRGHRVVLHRGGTIRGVVVDDRGRPVPGARVAARSTGSEISPPRGFYLPHRETLGVTWQTTLTGLDGTFTVRGIGEGPVDLRAAKRGYPAAGTVTRSRGGAAGVRLVLPSPFVALVRVVRADTGEPLFPVRVRIGIPGTGDPEAEGVEVAGPVDFRGEFRRRLALPAARAGELRAVVAVYGRENGEEVVPEVPLTALEEGKGFTVALQKRAPAVLLVKTAYDNGDPIPPWVALDIRTAAGTRIFRWGKRGKDGLARISLPPGTYVSIRPIVGSLGVSIGTAGGKEGPTSIFLRPGETRELDFVVLRGADVVVKVRTEAGLPPGMGKVTIRTPSKEVSRMFYGKRNEFRDVEPGPAEIVLKYDLYQAKPVKVTLVKGEKTEVTVTLRRKR